MKYPIQKTLLLSLLALSACSKQPSGSTSTPNDPGTPIEPVTQPTALGNFEVGTSKRLLSPARISTAQDGTVYVSDPVANQVLAFQNGQPTLALTGLDRPLGLAVFENLLYVGNAGRRDVEVYDLSTQRFLRVLSSAFEMPNAIAVAPDGEVYVVDSKRDLVSFFAKDGTLKGRIGGTGNGEGQFHFPSPIAVDQGRVVVGDQGNHRVQIFSRSGELLKSFGAEISEKAESIDAYRGNFTRIQGLALVDQQIYVLDSYHAYVQVLDAEGHSKGFFGKAGDCDSCIRLATDLTIDPAGHVLATDPEHRRWVSIPVEMR